MTVFFGVRLYRGIFRALTQSMPEAYSKLCQISKMIRHIENPGIVRRVYSGIFRHTEEHSVTLRLIFSHVQAYRGELRHTETYSGIVVAY